MWNSCKEKRQNKEHHKNCWQASYNQGTSRERKKKHVFVGLQNSSNFPIDPGGGFPYFLCNSRNLHIRISGKLGNLGKHIRILQPWVCEVPVHHLWPWCCCCVCHRSPGWRWLRSSPHTTVWTSQWPGRTWTQFNGFSMSQMAFNWRGSCHNPMAFNWRGSCHNRNTKHSTIHS